MASRKKQTRKPGYWRQWPSFQKARDVATAAKADRVAEQKDFHRTLFNPIAMCSILGPPMFMQRVDIVPGKG
jgi:hypothetical protein